MKDIFKHYKLPIIFGVVGLILAILLVSIVFFQNAIDCFVNGFRHSTWLLSGTNKLTRRFF